MVIALPAFIIRVWAREQKTYLTIFVRLRIILPILSLGSAVIVKLFNEDWL
jgi:hypothetical protein